MKIRKSIALAGFLTMVSAPAFAQFPPLPPLPPLPSLEIHIGTKAPPRPRRESRPPNPGRGYTWVGGSWDWHGGDWVWIDGRWDRPERSGVRWIAARYVRVGGGWRYEPAHWSHQRFVDGDDYRSWKEKHRKPRHDRRDHGRDRDHGRR